MRKKIKKIK